MELRGTTADGVCCGSELVSGLADEVRKTDGADFMQETSADETVLKGPGIESIVKSSVKLLQGEPEVLMDILQQVYETEKAMVDNLKPSEKEVELRRRRLEEIKELWRKLQDDEIDYEQARLQFLNMFEPDDIAALVDPFAHPVCV